MKTKTSKMDYLNYSIEFYYDRNEKKYFGWMPGENIKFSSENPEKLFYDFSNKVDEILISKGKSPADIGFDLRQKEKNRKE